MKLMTKQIEALAQKQFPMGSDFSQKIVAKFFDPTSNWTWYIMNQDPNDTDYLWGIVDGYDVEMGSISLSELKSSRGKFGLGIERDLHFPEMTAQEVWDKLHHNEHV